MTSSGRLVYGSKKETRSLLLLLRAPSSSSSIVCIFFFFVTFLLAGEKIITSGRLCRSSAVPVTLFSSSIATADDIADVLEVVAPALAAGGGAGGAGGGAGGACWIDASFPYKSISTALPISIRCLLLIFFF